MFPFSLKLFNSDKSQSEFISLAIFIFQEFYLSFYSFSEFIFNACFFKNQFSMSFIIHISFYFVKKDSLFYQFLKTMKTSEILWIPSNSESFSYFQNNEIWMKNSKRKFSSISQSLKMPIFPPNFLDKRNNTCSFSNFTKLLRKITVNWWWNWK